jgi:hypothetical protein
LVHASVVDDTDTGMLDARTEIRDAGRGLERDVCKRSQRFGPTRPQHDTVAGLDQASRHWRALTAEPDETYFRHARGLDLNRR